LAPPLHKAGADQEGEGQPDEETLDKVQGRREPALAHAVKGVDLENGAGKAGEACAGAHVCLAG